MLIKLLTSQFRLHFWIATLPQWVGVKSILRNVIWFICLSLLSCSSLVALKMSSDNLSVRRSAALPGAFSSWWSHLVCFVPSWYGHLCFVSHTFCEARSSRLCAMCPYDWAQPRPPSALASVASECRTLPRLTCWEDMCSLKRWTRPSQKKEKYKSSRFLQRRTVCWFAASLLVNWIAWTELSANEASYHVCPERKPPISPFQPPTWPASPQDLSCSLSIPSLGLSSLNAMVLTAINSSTFNFLSCQFFHVFNCFRVLLKTWSRSREQAQNINFQNFSN